MSIYPVRCYTCNSIIKQIKYEKLMFDYIFTSLPIARVMTETDPDSKQFIFDDPNCVRVCLDKMGVNRICCRRMYMGVVYEVSLDDLMHRHNVLTVWKSNCDNEEFTEPYKTLVKNDGKRVKLTMKKMEAKYPSIKFDIVKKDNMRTVLPIEMSNLKLITEEPPVFYMKSALDYFIEKNNVEYIPHSDIVIIAQPMLGA